VTLDLTVSSGKQNERSTPSVEPFTFKVVQHKVYATGCDYEHTGRPCRRRQA
jgi:hypothetical protein